MTLIILTVISTLATLIIGVAALMLLLPAPNFYLFALGIGALEWAPWVILATIINLGLLIGLGSAGGSYRTLLIIDGIASIAALVIISGVLISALRSDLVIRSTMPQVTDAGGASFSLARFLQGGPDGGAVERDVVYASVDSEPLTLDVYTSPPTDTDPHPAIVVVHGGSWRTGAKGEAAATSRAWAAQGYVVFDVMYRLAPQHHFPAAVGDVKCAIGYIKANATRYAIDPDRLVLVGRSAGGQIALIAAYTPAVSDLPPSCPAGDTSVAGVIAYYPPTDLDYGYRNRITPELTGGALDDYIGGGPDQFPEQYRLATPLTWVGPNTPPTLLLHGDRDQFVRLRDSRVLTDALEQAGRPYAFVAIPQANHGFDFNAAGPSNQRIQPFVDRFLKSIKDK